MNNSFLIIKPSSLGDVVHTLPLVHCLKRSFPSVQIGWVVQNAYADLLRCDSSVDSVYPINIPSTSEPGAGRAVYFKAFTATLKSLVILRRIFKATPYEKVLDLHASMRSGLLGLTCPGARRIGFSDAKEGNTWFQHEHVQVPPGEMHALEKNLLFAKHLYCQIDPSDFFMECDEQDRQQVGRLLQKENCTRPLAYFATTARWESKFWQKEKWQQLAIKLHQIGLQPVVGGGTSDISYTELLCEGASSSIVNVAGKLSLSETVALLQMSSVYVGLDTGPMHMAAMIGLPVVALFGPTHPERVGPYGVEHRIIRKTGLHCLSCRKRNCADMGCMQGISVDQVFAAVRELLPDL